MDVSILIVGWNSRHFLYDCLKSVYAKTKGIQYEIIYIDNGSKDHSIEMVKKEFPQVKIIENKENLGFTKANNQGIKIARGRYILLLNSDTIILDNAIANTVKFADEHPAAAVVGCKVFESDRKSIQRTAFQFYSTLTMIFDVLYLRKLFLRSKFFNRKR